MTFTTASGDCRLRPAGGRTELVWKHDIRFGCKGLRLKAKDADQIDYCQLDQMAVVKVMIPRRIAVGRR